MKKLLLLLLAGATISSTNAQTPEKKNVSMIGKMTATWCGPCGSWGWTLYNDVITAGGNNAFPISYYSSTSSSWDNTDFYNQTAANFAGVIGGSGYPTFSVNLFNHSAANTSGGSVNTAGTKSDVNAAVTAHAAATVVAATGMTYKITGNDIEVVTKTMFYEAANGTYKLAVYLVEDDAQHIQAGQTGTVGHHNVLRASMSATTWGEQIATGSIAANSDFSKTYNFTVTDSKWDKTKLKPVAILYKVNGTKHDYVNGTEHYSFPTSVATVNNVQNVAVYPNPATTQATVSFDAAKATTASVIVTDAMGRQVYNSGSLNVSNGRTIHTINTASIAAGIYNITIVSEEGTSTQRLSVSK